MPRIENRIPTLELPGNLYVKKTAGVQILNRNCGEKIGPEIPTLFLSKDFHAGKTDTVSIYSREAQENLTNSRVLIVLGHNMGPLSGPKDIELDADHLSIYSKVSAFAAGVLLEKKIVDKIIFSSGHTSGKHIRSEAQAMKDYVLKLNKFEISASDIITEAESLETQGNAEETKKILEFHGFKQYGMMTTGDHFNGAFKIFNRNGVNLKREDCFISEEVVRRYFTEKGIDSRDEFIDWFRMRDILKLVTFKEGIRDFLLETFDPDARYMRKLAEFLRRKIGEFPQRVKSGGSDIKVK